MCNKTVKESIEATKNCIEFWHPLENDPCTAINICLPAATATTTTMAALLNNNNKNNNNNNNSNNSNNNNDNCSCLKYFTPAAHKSSTINNNNNSNKTKAKVLPNSRQLKFHKTILDKISHSYIRTLCNCFKTIKLNLVLLTILWLSSAPETWVCAESRHRHSGRALILPKYIHHRHHLNLRSIHEQRDHQQQQQQQQQQQYHHLLAHLQKAENQDPKRMDIKVAKEAIKSAHKQAKETANSLKQLTASYYQMQFHANESELNNSWFLHSLDLNHPLNGIDSINVDIHNFKKIKKEIVNIRETLEILLLLFKEQTENRTINYEHNVHLNNLNATITNEIDTFFRISYEMIGFNLNEARNIVDILQQEELKQQQQQRQQQQQANGQPDEEQEQLQNEQPEPHDVQLDYDRTHPEKEYAMAAEHKKILDVIESFYHRLLQSLEELDERREQQQAA